LPISRLWANFTKLDSGIAEETN
jgi:hypothetical protein